MLGSHQAQSQVVLSDETDNYERLESLLSIMPDEFHALFPEINKEAIGRMQNQKSRDTEIYHLMDTALVFSVIENPKRYTYNYDEAGNLTINF